jgi:hypothetical protein
MIPVGGQRGSVLPISGIGAVLDSGTVLLAWKVLNPEPAGPKGRNCEIVESEAKTEAPSLVCVVTTKRGGGSWALVLVVDIFLIEHFSELRL